MRRFVNVILSITVFLVILPAYTFAQESIQGSSQDSTRKETKDSVQVQDSIKVEKKDSIPRTDTTAVDIRDSVTVADSVKDTTQTELEEIESQPVDSIAADTVGIEEEPEITHGSVGARKCRICHKDEYVSWLGTVHFSAFDLLNEEEKRNQECLECHTTNSDVKDVLLRGVQCEACHGSGADYSKTKIMIDKDLAIENGLLEQTEEVCTRCHNDKSPTFKGFSFEEAVQDSSAIHRKFERKHRIELKKKD